MQNEKIKELQTFANDFNKRLQLSELELEDSALLKKLNGNNIKNRRNKFSELNTISTSPIRSKSQFKPVI